MKNHNAVSSFNLWLKQNIIPSPKLGVTCNETIEETKMPEVIGLQDKIKILEIEDIFLIEDLTPDNVEFVERFLGKTNVDMESETNFFYITSTSQIIFMLRKVIQDYRIFLSKKKKVDD